MMKVLQERETEESKILQSSYNYKLERTPGIIHDLFLGTIGYIYVYLPWSTLTFYDSLTWEA